MIDYVREDYVYDRLGVFLKAVHEGRLVVDEVDEVSYKIGIESRYLLRVNFRENVGMVPYLEIDDLECDWVPYFRTNNYNRIN